ncbi:MAG: hypothetical protein RBS80_06555 [Thermoguttaceae bacterium]|jgi:hypothetical protein|nr:hypothetical protein [Thermoguttaceae bacterium]
MLSIAGRSSPVDPVHTLSHEMARPALIQYGQSLGSIKALSECRDEHIRSIAPMRPLAAEALRLEHRLSDLVNAAYHLTPDEIALLWQTAPPRMPIGGPSDGK